jgi:hypothetical protein
MAGQLAVGLTMKRSDMDAVNVGLNMGVTRDATDIALILRAPFFRTVSRG